MFCLAITLNSKFASVESISNFKYTTNRLMGQREPKSCLKTTKCNLNDNSWIHVFYLFLMFSLHLYKNTEYSRVFTQSGNCYVCFLAPRLISCLEPFDLSSQVDWNGRPKPLLEMSLSSVLDRSTTLQRTRI